MELRDLAGKARQEGARILSNAQMRQGIYDKVLCDGHGRSVAEVRDLLAREWREAFGEDMAEPDLSQFAGALARGERVEVKVTKR
jgi:hypothetical protein